MTHLLPVGHNKTELWYWRTEVETNEKFDPTNFCGSLKMTYPTILRIKVPDLFE